MPQFVHAPAIGPLLLAVLLPGTATATALLPAPGFGSRLTLSCAGERQGAADGVDGVERDDFDVVLGYVFEASEATVPINFIKLPDGQPELVPNLSLPPSLPHAPGHHLAPSFGIPDAISSHRGVGESGDYRILHSECVPSGFGAAPEPLPVPAPSRQPMVDAMGGVCGGAERR